MEHWGCHPGKVSSNIHTGKYNWVKNTNKGNSRVINNPFDDFHTYKFDWNANRLIMYVDNVELFRYDNNERNYDAWPFDQEMNIILNLAVDSKCAGSGGGGGGSGGVDQSAFPAEFLVDYVRQYAPN